MVKKIILILLFVSVSFFGFANDVPARCEKYVEALETELAEVKDALAETNEMLATVTDALEVTTEKYVEAKEQIKADQVEIETLRDSLEDCLVIETIEEKFSFGIGVSLPSGGIVYLSFNPFEIPLGLFGMIGINKAGFLVGFGLDFDF